MAESYGWAGKVLRVNLSTGAITSESMDKYKDFMGGTGLAWKVLMDEVPPGTTAFAPEAKVVFGVGPATGSGSPCSGRTSVSCLWPVHGDELPSAGHMGGHWGPELKYAGWDGVIVEGVSAKPVWLRIEDDKVTLEDASTIWGQGIYRATNYICNIMGPEAHVAAIGQAGENRSRLGAVFCDRSHRAGGAGGVLGSKLLKAIGVRGTGAVKIALNKKDWRSLNNYYLSLMGANNQCVVARTLQPWSEFSPGGTRWSGAPGVKWGSALPPVDMGYCPDAEHPMINAPFPTNKIGFRTHKGFNDFGEEGLKRTVRMDGCHSCPIRCHIAADHPELENYGVARYNMNTCAGNGGMRGTFIADNAMNAQQGTMLNAYMSNHLEGDYGIWNDYSGYQYVWEVLMNFAGTEGIVADEYVPATVANTRSDAAPGSTIPNPLIGQPLLRKYLTAAEWTRLRTTAIWSSGKSPLALMEAGDPRWLQWFAADFAANVQGTTGWFMGRGPAWISKLGAETTAARAAIMYTPTGLPAGVTATPVEIRKALPADYGVPELVHAMSVDGHVHMWKQAHTLHHSIETQSQMGALLSTFQACRDMNNHTLQNFNTNGLPNSKANPLKLALAQEIACSPDTYFQAPDESAQGKWAWQTADYRAVAAGAGPVTPMNKARAGLAAQCIISYELQNSLTQCNYTLPVWASPLKSRDGTIASVTPPGSTTAVATKGYRGDPKLDVKVFNAVTGLTMTQAEYEKMGHRMYTLWRIYTARIMNARNATKPGANMRTNFDQAPAWAFDPANAVSVWGTLDAADWETAKDMLYDMFGYTKTTGLPTETKLTELGLASYIPTLKAEGVIP
ncbi:MAG: aldehyde ferredoxin oxidoreductase N-terminal domain-containing protein [Anaeromyxobacteraceae bacterium]